MRLDTSRIQAARHGRPRNPGPRKGEAPRPPKATPALRKAKAERKAYLRDGEAKEQHSVLRGLILLAILVLVFTMVRVGTERVFYAGWWRQW